MNNTIKKLPDAELEVMQAIWACKEPVLRSDIDDILKDTHPMAPTTLLTLLSRLAEKGFIHIEKTARFARYYPLVKQEDYLANESHLFINRLFKGNLSIFANALCDSGLTKEEIAELRAMLGRDDEWVLMFY